MLIKKININCIDKELENKKYFATEIKSEMRFWFRILNSMQTSLKDVYKEEGCLFGNTTAKSPIKILVNKEIENRLSIYFILEVNFKHFKSSKFFSDSKFIDDISKLDWYLNLFKVSFMLGNIGKGRKQFNTNNVIKKYFKNQNFTKEILLKSINDVIINNYDNNHNNHNNHITFLANDNFENFFKVAQVKSKTNNTVVQIWAFDVVEEKRFNIEKVLKSYKKNFKLTETEQIIMTKFHTFKMVTYINKIRNDVAR